MTPLLILAYSLTFTVDHRLIWFHIKFHSRGSNTVRVRKKQITDTLHLKGKKKKFFFSIGAIEGYKLLNIPHLTKLYFFYDTDCVFGICKAIFELFPSQYQVQLIQKLPVKKRKIPTAYLKKHK